MANIQTDLIAAYRAVEVNEKRFIDYVMDLYPDIINKLDYEKEDWEVYSSWESGFEVPIGICIPDYSYGVYEGNEVVICLNGEHKLPW